MDSLRGFIGILLLIFVPLLVVFYFKSDKDSLLPSPGVFVSESVTPISVVLEDDKVEELIVPYGYPHSQIFLLPDNVTTIQFQDQLPVARVTSFDGAAWDIPLTSRVEFYSSGFTFDIRNTGCFYSKVFHDDYFSYDPQHCTLLIKGKKTAQPMVSVNLTTAKRTVVGRSFDVGTKAMQYDLSNETGFLFSLDFPLMSYRYSNNPIGAEFGSFYIPTHNDRRDGVIRFMTAFGYGEINYTAQELMNYQNLPKEISIGPLFVQIKSISSQCHNGLYSESRDDYYCDQVFASAIIQGSDSEYPATFISYDSTMPETILSE